MVDANMTDSGDKGTAILITGGKNVGKTGWYVHPHHETDHYVYVILVAKDKREYKVKVRKEYVTIQIEPSHYAEAIVAENPDLQEAINKVCRLLCKFEMGRGDPEAILEIIRMRFARLWAAEEKKGNKRVWRKVQYKRPSNVKSEDEA